MSSSSSASISRAVHRAEILGGLDQYHAVNVTSSPHHDNASKTAKNAKLKSSGNSDNTGGSKNTLGIVKQLQIIGDIYNHLFPSSAINFC